MHPRTAVHSRPRSRVGAPLAAVSTLFHGLAAANPDGAQIVAGQVSIGSADANSLRIDQTSHSAIINWQSFSIGADDFVQFNQPSASAAVLNRVVGGLPSEILGDLSANGRVFLVNPQGIMFGAGARIDVGSLVASTLDIADQDFLAGRYVFVQGAAAPAEVANAGHIRAAGGGFVLLLAEGVSNHGTIEALHGTVTLASASAATLALDPDGLVSLSLDQAALSTLAGVVQSGEIVADGGTVRLSARVARELMSTAVNNEGRIQARSVESRDGAIYLSAEGGDIVNSGVLDAAGSAGADGGYVRVVSDRNVRLDENSAIDVRGGVSGGTVAVSGRESLRLRGSLQIGRGGLLALDPADVTIGDGSSGLGCTASFCEAQLEQQLQSGASVNIVASNSITLENLSDNLLDGRNANGSGGSLFLGIGSSSAGSFFRGRVGSISFTDFADAIRLDGGFEALAGASTGTALLGTIETRQGIRVESGDDVIFDQLVTLGGASGGVSVQSFFGRALGNRIASAGNVAVRSDIFQTLGGIIDIGSIAAAGDVSLRAVHDVFLGDAAAGGLIDATAGDGTIVAGNLSGTQIFLLAARGITAGNVDTALASFDAGGSGNLAMGALTGADALLRAGGTVSMQSVALTDNVNGAGLRVFAGRGISVGGGIDIAGARAAVQGTGFQGGAGLLLLSDTGDVSVAGPVSVSGSLGAISSSAAFNGRGALAEFHAGAGNVSLGSTLTVSGQIGSAVGGANAEAIGAHAILFAGSGGAVSVAGDIVVSGSVGSAQLGSHGRARGAEADIGNFSAGGVALGGGVSVTGTMGNGVYGSSGGVHQGAFLLANGGFGNLDVAGAVTVTGTAGDATGGFHLNVRGAYAEVNAGSSGNVNLGGPVTVTGSAGHISALWQSNLVGAQLFTGPAYGSLTVAGDIIVAGQIASVTGTSSMTAIGGDASIGRTAFSGSGTSLVDLRGSLSVRGTPGMVSAGPNSLVVGANVNIRAPQGPIVAGDMTVVSGLGSSTDGAANLSISGGDHITLGALTVRGNLDAFGSHSRVFVYGANLYVQATDFAFGDSEVLINGPVLVDGVVGSGSSPFLSGQTFLLRGGNAEIYNDDGNITLMQGVTVNGTIGDILGGSDVSVLGAHLIVTPRETSITRDSGVVRVFGNTVVNGHVASLRDAFFTDVRGAELVLGDAANAETPLTNVVDVQGDILINGSVGTVDLTGIESGAQNPVVIGSDLFLRSYLDIATSGAVTISGAVTEALFGENAFLGYVAGTYLSIASTQDGSIVFNAPLSANGNIGTVTGGEFLTARGTDFFLYAFGPFFGERAIEINDAIQLDGHIGNVTATHSLDAAGTNVFVLSLSATQQVGDFIANGSIDQVSALFAPILSGSRVYYNTFFGDTVIQGNISVTGRVSDVLSGDNLSLYAASLYINGESEFTTTGVTVTGNLDAHGEVGTIASTTGSDLVETDVAGAFVFVGSTFNDVTLDGLVNVSGIVPVMNAVEGGSGIPPINGADLIRNPAGLSIPEFSLGGLFQPEGNVPLPSEIAIVTNGSVYFRDMAADNIFVHFNFDSVLDAATLNAAGYVDLFTPTFGPTLSANSLAIGANNILLSANLDVQMLDVHAGNLLFGFAASLRGGTASLSGRDMILSNYSLDFSGPLSLSTQGGLLFATHLFIGNAESTNAVDISAGSSLFLDQSSIHGGAVSLSAPEFLILFGTGASATQLSLSAGTPAPDHVVFDDQLSFLNLGGVIFADEFSALQGGSLTMTAATAVLSQAAIQVGTGTTFGADTLLLEQLAQRAPELVPTAAQPNANFDAPIVSLASLAMDGDFLRVHANFTYLDGLALTAPSFVHLQPVSDLPVFTESVTIDRAGLQEAAEEGQIATRDNRLIPTIGALSGSLGEPFPSLADFILQSGLADNTLVIGSSSYNASIQISDELAVNVLPSHTNFVFMTSGGILLVEPIQTNGRVVLLGEARIFTDSGQFYAVVREEIAAHYAALDAVAAGDDLPEGEEDREGELLCE